MFGKRIWGKRGESRRGVLLVRRSTLRRRRSWSPASVDVGVQLSRGSTAISIDDGAWHSRWDRRRSTKVLTSLQRRWPTTDLRRVIGERWSWRGVRHGGALAGLWSKRWSGSPYGVWVTRRRESGWR
ncbi:hypothetical protein M6B38_380815 [Iris pallida]|uniref:Uncharacterized protein n=1 Tax=Iris pallida TaxID=29817 RepID=A0AAX6G8B6_IRIPA|nr:hypothetical protein M6B38_380815 [Iris pallida]